MEEQSYEKALPDLRHRGIFPPSRKILPWYKICLCIQKKITQFRVVSVQTIRGNEVRMAKQVWKHKIFMFVLKSKKPLKGKVFVEREEEIE